VVQSNYRRALEAAIKEYDQLTAQRDAVETRLAQLRLIISNLGALCGLPAERRPSPDLGLTDACRSALRASLGGLTAAQVRERLASLGIDSDQYSNLLASIHVVLKRLVAAGEIWTYKAKDGNPVYAWKRAAVPYAVSNPELATAIVTGGLMWPGAVEIPRKAPPGKRGRKKER
jgi:hypothetical protein